ncbi:transposase (plasmid) [Streptomyces sp. NBC_00841]|uniref:transposase n=1 Tax=unclassified Streptomyces TaxID=2593676 RepID=UPI0022560943|nr:MULTISPECIES: transposase [unclassified Streptomyces]MCX4537659.1 transposase [Streptomyces sp. NBC_01669]MCX4538158.1 transposase [Streptomyces sp. NBC_01669]WSA05096.1 transposase [Streptomyces sp. NBC_00841]WSA05846.1 transposase [Streptomyces sp. NBC_00841]
MAEKRRKFDAEFREGAVRIVSETGRPIAQVAKDLGINETTLSTWVSRAKKAGGDGTLSVPEREELARLRRQDAEKNKRIRELEMERDVLKRCMVLWVK